MQTFRQVLWARLISFLVSSSSYDNAAPWLSGRASERGIRRFEVGFLMGTQIFLLCPTLATRWKTSFSISLPSLKLTISLILFTARLFLKFVIFLGGLEVWQWLCAAFQKCRRTDISWRPEGRGVLKLIYSWLLLLSLLLLWLLLFYSWGQKSRRDLLKTIVKGTCTSHPPLPLCVNLAVRNYFLVTCQYALSYPSPLLFTMPRIMIQTEVTWCEV